MSQDYELLEKVYADGEIPVLLYKNKVTGLRVVIAQAECPIVYADLCFATEAFDDDGLPHTLEHLVFLGSEDYPYKGVLDLLANRCLSDGTNAWTDTDHTNYTVSTAGSEGLLNLLPVYLDHLLFPTLTDEGFTTEVHHVDGNGVDGGIVYCEMQAIENSGGSRCHLEMLRSMYPGICGYKSETGGLMENLRTSTNNLKVRKYHKDFYHSKNLCILLTGPLQPDEVFEAIRPIEDKIVKKGMHQVEFSRPWQTPVEPLKESIRRTIQYSSETDDDGIVYYGFRGPNVIENFEEFIALTIILDYLTDTAISPLERDFVECDEPYCSSVSYSAIENYTSCFYFDFDSVGKQHLHAVADKLCDLLAQIQEGREDLDMSRLKTIIQRKKASILSAAEVSAHSIITGPVIGHFLYGNGPLGNRAKIIPVLEKFSQCESKFWLDLMYRYLTGPESRHVCIVGEPSPSLMKTMVEAEKRRLAEQKKNLKDELPILAEKLKHAMEFNDQPVPQSMLTMLPLPSIEKIRFHQIERVVLGHETSMRIQYDSIKTNFLTINLIIDTSSIVKADRLFLPILTELLTECPIMRGNELISYENVVAELYSDTVSYDAGVGLSSSSSYAVGQVSMALQLAMQVEVEKYQRAVEWCREILYQTVFTPERIKTMATKLVSEISQYKRSGSKLTSSAIGAITFQSNSNQWATNFMRQQKFLKRLLKELKENPDEVQQRITKVRDSLTGPNNILVHLTLNKDKIDVSKIQEPWLSVVPSNIVGPSQKEHIRLESITPCHQLIQPVTGPKMAVVGVGSVESNFMHQLVRSINSPEHPDLPAVHVLISYLTQLEGPLWKQVRGGGLSYSYNIGLSSSDGLISVSFSRATRLLEAYERTVEVVNNFIDGTEDFEDSQVVSAKAALIFGLIKREKSPAAKSMMSLMSYVRNLDINFNKELIKKIERVTKEDLRRVGPLYLKPLFEDPDRLAVVCCNKSKVDELISGMAKLNGNFEPLSLDEETFWNSIE